ncbi:MAG: aryl-sulfate sulfotransferase [Ignavibacteriae bacterium]|nr:aryl-sulfate sulfotransferase [Ignavibacteriota bacterium]
MSRIILITFLFVTFHLQLNAVDPEKLNVSIMDNPAPGYLFLTPTPPGTFYLVDNPGYPIYVKNLGGMNNFINLNVEPIGLISYFSAIKYFIMNDSEEILDSIRCKNNYDTDFHDFTLFPNGHAVLIGGERRFVDMSQKVPGGNTNAVVFGNVIQEIDENKNVVFEWKSLDHFDITDVTPDINILQPTIISCHMNSVFYDTDGNIIFSSRVLDEITKINKLTGEIIWRLGGKMCKNNQFQFLNDTIDDFYGFSHQHSVARLANGNLFMFDNGNLKPQPYSRAVEYRIDETNKTIEKVWEFFDTTKVFSMATGNAQRLPNGNTFIGWGANGKSLIATEVRPDGSKTLEIKGFPSQSYAAYKNIYKMHAVTLNIENQGIYIFDKDTNITGIKLQVKNFTGSGNISAEEHFYPPHNLEFTDDSIPETGMKRWVISRNGISDFSATIKFNINYDSSYSADEYHIYGRAVEGSGKFERLETIYNINEKCFEAEINNSGEFIIGFVPVVSAPVCINPPDSAVEVTVQCKFVWEPVSISSYYRLQVSDNHDFFNIIVDSSNIADTTFNLNLDYNTKYYWRIKAFNEDKQSTWSKTNTFTTSPESGINYNDEGLMLTITQMGNKLLFKRNISGRINFSLYDILGNPVTGLIRNFNDNNNEFELNIKDFYCGIYFYRIILADKIEFGKLYIEN